MPLENAKQLYGSYNFWRSRSYQSLQGCMQKSSVTHHSWILNALGIANDICTSANSQIEKQSNSSSWSFWNEFSLSSNKLDLPGLLHTLMLCMPTKFVVIWILCKCLQLFTESLERIISAEQPLCPKHSTNYSWFLRTRLVPCDIAGSWMFRSRLFEDLIDITSVQGPVFTCWSH